MMRIITAYVQNDQLDFALPISCEQIFQAVWIRIRVVKVLSSLQNTKKFTKSHTEGPMEEVKPT